MFSDKPFVKFILPFIAGILVGIYFPFKEVFNYSHLILLVFILFLITDHCFFKINKKYKYRFMIAGIIHLAIFLSGFQLTYFHSYILNASDNLVKITEGNIVAQIIETPVKKGKSIKTIIDLIAIRKKNVWNELRGKAIIYIEKDSLSILLKTKDKIIFSPDFKKIEPPKNPGEFNYKQYLSFHHISHQAYLKSGTWVYANDSRNNLKRIASDIRNYLLGKLKNVIPHEQSYSVASALILGYKDELDTDIQKAYAGSGAMHVLAVSGLHAGFIFMILNAILFFLESNKKTLLIKMVIVIIGLWFYALNTGLSPSVMRAATMFSFIVIGKTINRQTNIYNTLAASAFILLCFNPYLIMEVGFQLSYLAVIGIVYFQPKIYNLFYIKNYLLDKLWAITCVSIAAQLTTFPLGLLYFHQFPNYFLFSNLLVIPLATLILGCGILLFIFSFIPIIYSILGFVISWLIYTLNYSVQFIEKLPYSITEGIDISITECWIIFIIILLFALYIENKKYIYIFSSLILVLTLCIYNLTETVYQKKQKKVVIYHINNLTAINFIDGYDNILIADGELLSNTDKMRFHIYHNWYKLGLKKEKKINIKNLDKKNDLFNLSSINNNKLFVKENYFQFHNKTFAIIFDRKQLYDTLQYRLPIDYVIITKNPDITMDDIYRNFEFKEIIADASNSNYKINKWVKELLEKNSVLYNIKENGAWVLNLK